MARKAARSRRSYARPRVRARSTYTPARRRSRPLASGRRSAPTTLRIVVDNQAQQPQLAAFDPRQLLSQPRGRRF